VIAIESFLCLWLGSRDRRDHGQLSLGRLDFDFASSMPRLPLTEAVVAAGFFFSGVLAGRTHHVKYDSQRTCIPQIEIFSLLLSNASACRKRV
jgi:hypothetical protein